MGTARDRVGVKLSHPPCETAAAGDVEKPYSTFEKESLRRMTEQTDPSLVKKSTPNPKIH